MQRSALAAPTPGASALFVAGLLCLLAACQPSDRTPGLWLRGELVDTLPAEWSFTDAHPEIYVQVDTPYLIPHSVTIWCAQVDGELYIGARDPDTKNWPGWLDDNRDIRLKIGKHLYDVRAADVTNTDRIEHIRAAYRAKYKLEAMSPTVRYWAILPRA